jgi:hypothetical protein
MDSASREVLERQASLAGNGAPSPRGATPRASASRLVPGCLQKSKRPLAGLRASTGGSVPTRPAGAPQIIQSGVAGLGKGMPFPVTCALSWIIWGTLNPSIDSGWSTGSSSSYAQVRATQAISKINIGAYARQCASSSKAGNSLGTRPLGRLAQWACSWRLRRGPNLT